VLRDWDSDIEHSLVSYSDSDFGSDLDTSYSTTGGITLLGPNPITFTSVKQTVISASTTEAEYIASFEVLKEQTIIYNSILSELGFKMATPVHKCDNQGAVRMATAEDETPATKYVRIYYHVQREWVKDNLIKMVYINTKLNIADAFTKALPVDKLLSLIKFLFNKDEQLPEQAQEAQGEQHSTRPSSTRGRNSKT
jgi:hypothetical protein